LILVTAIVVRPKPGKLLLVGSKERYGDSLGGRGSNTQPPNRERILYHRTIAAPDKQRFALYEAALAHARHTQSNAPLLDFAIIAVFIRTTLDEYFEKRN